MTIKKISTLLLPLVATMALQANDPLDDPFFKDPFGDDIFGEMMQMQQDMDKMFERMHQRIQKRSSGSLSPVGTYKMAIQNQVTDQGDHYAFVTSIPESKENHIDINSENGTMSITAKIIEEKENKTANSVSSSRSVRMYQQSILLPKDADESAISTAYKKGRLVVLIQKKNGKKVAKPEETKIDNMKEDNRSTQKKDSVDENSSSEENTTRERTILTDQVSMR